MKAKTQFIAMTFLVLLSHFSFGQGGLGGNTRPIGGWPLGWTGGFAGSLEIRNNFTTLTSNINFFTGGAQRMAIKSSAYPIPGAVGIAQNTPQGMLHINNNGAVFQLVLESTGTNPDMTFANFTGVKAQIRYLMSGLNRGLGFAADDTHMGWTGLPTEQIYINGTSGRIGLGSNVFNAQNRVEITSQAMDFGFGSVNGSSGLRFTNLTAANTPISPNPGTGILSVNMAGDIIYVPDGPLQPGNYCSVTPTNPLTGDFEIPLAGNNYYFTGNDIPDNSSVSVGRPCNFVLTAKFNSYQNLGAAIGVSTTAGGFRNEDVASTINLIYTGISADAIGVQTQAKIINRGGYFSAANAPDVRGAVMEIGPSPVNTATAYGGEFNVSSTALLNVGVISNVTGSTATGGNIGVSGSVSGSSLSNIGARFSSVTPNGSATNIGVAGNAGRSTARNAGGAFTTSLTIGGTTGTNIGVSGVIGNLNTTLLPADYAVAVYGNSTNPNEGVVGYAGYFDGDVNVNGVLTVFGVPVISDQMFKTNIDSITNALGIIKLLKPKTFDFDTANTYGMDFPSQKQYGLIAQDVETVLPELITNSAKPPMADSMGNIVIPGASYKSLNYNAFIAILMKGIQEQQSKIDSLDEKNNVQDSINDALQNQINTLADAIESCCSNAHSINTNNSNGNIAAKDVELRDAQSIVLEQNVPNPFAEQTTINYFLPDNVVKAQMLFYNASGRLIQSVDLNEKGKGQLNVFASDLTNGIYTYSLVVDGKIFETKKMLKQ